MSKKNESKMGPEAFAALDRLTDEALAKQAKKGRRVTASEAIEKDTTAKPYSVRLTNRELFRLKIMSEMEEAKPAELARNLILHGLVQLEAKHVEEPDGGSESLQELYRLRNELVHMLMSVDEAITHASQVAAIEGIVPNLRIAMTTIEEAKSKAVR